MARRSMLLVVAVALLGGMLTACTTGIPDRREATEQITAALTGLPGVNRTDDTYSNDFTVGVTYRLTIHLQPGLSDEALQRITSTWLDQVGREGLPGHGLTLRLVTADRDEFVMYGSRGRPLDPTIRAPQWFRLTEQLPGTVRLVDSGCRREQCERWDDRDMVAVKLDGVGEVGRTIDAIDKVGADVTGVRWSVHTTGLTVEFVGTLPADLRAEVPTMSASGRSWSIRYDPTGDPILLTESRYLGTGTALEADLRDDLDRLSTLGLRLDHQARLSDTPKLTVSIGACRTDGSILQQRLNRDYGTC